MTKKINLSKIAIYSFLVFSLMFAGSTLVSADTIKQQENGDRPERTERPFAGKGEKGESMHQEGKRGAGFVTEEIMERIKESHQDLTEEEKEAFKEERKENRESKKAEMEAFIGVTHEEMREAREEGKTMSDILAENGKTQADAEAFLRSEALEKIDSMVENHNLSSEDRESMLANIDEYVSNHIERWFGQ